MISTTPVVVLPSGHHGDLGIARSLGRLGIPVFAAGAAWWEPVCRSRFCRGCLPFRMDAGRLVEAVSKFEERPILMPTTDSQAVWAADHASTLREGFQFPDQDAGLVRTLSDKSLMQHLARQCGVPSPQSAVPGSRYDVEQFLETAAFPVMVKATNVESLRRRAGGTKFIVRTPRELLDLWTRAEDPEGPNLMIQEFIPGEDWMFDGYFDRNSDCLFGVAGRKIRRFPVHTGVTSLGVCIRNETVEQTTRQFMKAIGYQGILDIGYRRDERDGQYKVLDVNPRIGCTFRLFAGTGGMDVARVLYLDLTGQQVAASRPCIGRKWVVEDFDLVSSFRMWCEGSLRWSEWARSFRGVQERACFALDDPLPFLWMGFADLRELHSWLHRRPAGKSAVNRRDARTPIPDTSASLHPGS